MAIFSSFCTPDDVVRYRISYGLFNARMKEGALITDHVLYMIKQIEKLSKLGFSLHQQLEKDAILNSLSKSYLSFLSYFRMMKPVVNYHDLLGLLHIFKKDHQLHKEMINLVGGSSSGVIIPLRKKKKE